MAPGEGKEQLDTHCTNNAKDATKDDKDMEKCIDGDISQEAESLLERDTWGKKLDFLLSVVGFAVDLGNVWRFPYICYRNGGGAFLIPYFIMYIFGGLPLFYMELALGQLQRTGCISVWKRICPMFKGIGFGICFIASYVAMYYNTVIAWSVYFLFSSFTSVLPWASCNNTWNTPRCISPHENKSLAEYGRNESSAKEFYFRGVLEFDKSNGIDDIGDVKWSLALCLMAVFIIVYFSLWKGIKSSGKAVWITATVPYIILIILLIRGVMLPGSAEGILYYLTPRWHMLKNPRVWTDAAAQIFFSLGPGFGVLLALSSYNKFHNNCYKDAIVTSTINCLTSFLAGFVVFSVLGYMAYKQSTNVENIAKDVDVGLVFIVYPEAIATLAGSSFWAIIFFLMLITLGLDSTFGGLEALITGVCDEWPQIFRRRQLFVAALILYCFLGALPTTTYGGNYIVSLLDSHGAPIPILFICFLEAIAVSWFYGVENFANDVAKMIGFRPGKFWIICWAYISPIFLLTVFLMSLIDYGGLRMGSYVYPEWTKYVGWCIILSSLLCIPAYMAYRFARSKGTLRERWEYMVKPEEVAPHLQTDGVPMGPVAL